MAGASTSGVKREVEDSDTGPSKKHKLSNDQVVKIETKKEEEEEDEQLEEIDEIPDLPTFTCSRCSKTLSIPSDLIATLKPDYNPSAIQVLFEKEKAEHVDYHFARDMFEEERNVEREALRGPAAGGKKAKSSETKSSSSKGSDKGREEGQKSLKGFFSKK